MKSSAQAGALAALAGMFGKVLGLARLVSLALMLATNAAMLGFFVKGLHETDSLTATVTSAAVNFMLSAAGGHALFGEHLPVQWFVGATIILVGMGCLLYGDTKDEETTKEKQS
ncbi:hypothetical protein P43SY_008585 [Pythium insidiosum]|uniref:Uncharacterized protein n=1 Tax=Pythium insidiosum TaxID=114742 RepID=A0AAD5LDL8_PYTIN|nr:hypothetical protein ATCC90586_008645 [Pythium insidiosum]KAJ0397257.1 hypothetical protein P43SY_008585 [Pythium insidiosum]